MKKENKLDNDFMASEKDINIKPIIYLDTNRLYSYSSQLLDGLVQVRRLAENEGNKYIETSDDEYTEIVQEDAKEGEITLGPKNYAGGISGKTIDKTTNKKGFRKGSNTKSDEFLSSSSEDIVDHDNGYLKFEEDLIKKGILKEIQNVSQLKQYSSLIKITGTFKFFDWDSIIETLSDREILSIFIDSTLNHNQKKNKEKEMNVALKIIKTFSLGSITIHTQVENSNIVGSINPDHLRMTREQLRSAYIMPGDVEATIVGFIPRRRVEKTNFPGIAGMIDMAELWKVFVGEVDTVIDPIAIYTEIN